MTDLKDLFRRRPFQPFVIHTAGGQAVVVERAEAMNISPDETRIAVFTPDGHFHLIDVPQITQLEGPSAPSAT